MCQIWFENGYAASIRVDTGRKKGIPVYEVASIFVTPDDWHFADDPIRCQTGEQLLKILRKIRKMPRL